MGKPFFYEKSWRKTENSNQFTKEILKKKGYESK